MSGLFTPKPGPLFGGSKREPPKPRRQVAATSREAYHSELASGRVGSIQREIHDALHTAKFLWDAPTGRELEAHLKRPGAWKRLSEMERKGLVERCRVRVCRVSGKRATTWRAIY